MGGGKGAIDHYVSPVRAGRLVLEMGGKIELGEVEPVLKEVAKKLPFPAKVGCSVCCSMNLQSLIIIYFLCNSLCLANLC